MRREDRPKWLDVLAGADDVESWLAAMLDADEAATQGLLRRHDLPDAGLRSGRVEEIQRALTDGKVVLSQLAAWREDVLDVFIAVEGIDDFRQRWPLAQDFRARNSLPNGDLDTIMAEIRGALWRGDIPLQTWVEFLDDRREEIDRDLFLYQIPAGRLRDLERWVDPQGLADELRLAGFDCNTRRFLWRPTEPSLLGADVDSRVLRLRWVGWRRFDNDNGTVDEQRCLTFVRIHLDTGAAELQLQHIDRGGMRVLAAERNLYLRATAHLLNATPEPVRLEPAMRSLMTDEHLALHSWRVRLSTGDILTGKGQTDLFSKVKAGLDKYYALELAGEWKVAPDVTVTVKIDARTDAITIKEQCPTTRVESLVALVRQHAGIEAELEAERNALEDLKSVPAHPDKLTEADAKIEELRPTVERLIAYQRRLGHSDVAVARLATKEATNDLLVTPATLQEALDKVGVRYLGATLYVLCPHTLRPVQQSGTDVLFERVADVPDEIGCDNHDGDPQRHVTKDNVYLRVGHDQPRTSFYVVYIAWLAFLLFLPLATWFFVWLRGKYPEQQAFIIGGYLVSLIAPVAAITKIYGKQNVQAAARILELLVKRRPSAVSDEHLAEARPPSHERHENDASLERSDEN